MRVLVIDNFDSFTFNLVQALGALGAEVTVVRSDAMNAEGVASCGADRLLLSPGPGRPADAGISVDAIRIAMAVGIPTLGVCLGHQCIAVALGARVTHARAPVHGKTSMVDNDGYGVFYRLPKKFEAARYHSLVVDRQSLPRNLIVTAETETGEVMGIRHTSALVEGVQFHPESFMTRYGKELLSNFLAGRVGGAS